MIDNYGTTNVRYMVMTFGDRPKILAPFADKQSPGELKKIIESVMPSSGTPDLVSALVEAEKLFDEAGTRPDAKKFLILIMDNKSRNERVNLTMAANPLVEQECWLVPVAIENKEVVEECWELTPLKNMTIEVPKTGSPDKLVEEITDKMKEGKFLFSIE